MTGSKDRGMAALLRAYGASIGKNVRTAQRHRMQNHPDWLRFVGTQAVAVVAAKPERTHATVAALSSLSPVAADREPPPPCADEDDEHLHETQQMEKQHWLLWKEATKQWKAAMLISNDMLAAGFASLCIKARQEYIKARQAREAWEVAERRVVPISEFTALRAGFIVPLGNLMRNMPAELATLVNPNNPAHALAQATTYLVSRLQPQIHALITALDDYAPSGVAEVPAAA